MIPQADNRPFTADNPDNVVKVNFSRLTPERIEKTIRHELKKESGAKLKAYYKTCIHCGLCSDACHYYLSRNQYREFSPAGKIKNTLWKMYKRKGRVTPEFMRHAAKIVYTECNLCKRCAMHCPFGIDVAHLLSVVRRICRLLGIHPPYFPVTAHSRSAAMNRMWVKEDERRDIRKRREEAGEKISLLRIPFEKSGADVMYSMMGFKPGFQSRFIYQAAIIFRAAGIDWTMPAVSGWDGGEMAMLTGDNELTVWLTRTHYAAALRLKARRIVMGECGHTFGNVYGMSNRRPGRDMRRIPVSHAISFYHELLADNKLTVKKKYPNPVTLFDPCKTSRKTGLHDKAGEIVEKTCETVIKMTPGRGKNYCRVTSGGVINCGPPPSKNNRVSSNRTKVEQLLAAKARGASVIIAPCHNCYAGLADINLHYGLDMRIRFLGDILYEVIDKPE